MCAEEILPFWIARDYLKCSGCRKCEIACSLFHEKRIWPEASRIRVFMLVPGAEVTTLDGDHSPFLSRPEALADALLAAIPDP